MSWLFFNMNSVKFFIKMWFSDLVNIKYYLFSNRKDSYVVSLILSFSLIISVVLFLSNLFLIFSI